MAIGHERNKPRVHRADCRTLFAVRPSAPVAPGALSAGLLMVRGPFSSRAIRMRLRAGTYGLPISAFF
jgi:hypothetical protein